MGSNKTKIELIKEVGTLRKRVAALEREESLGSGETLSSSEQQFRDLAEKSVQGFYIQDNFKMLFANLAAARFFGYASVDALMKIDSVLDLLAPHERARARELNLRRRTQKEVPHHLEYKAIHKDGTSFWMEIIAQIVIWEGREAVHSTLVDITERRQSKAALLESEAKYRNLVETSHDLIWRSDKEGRFTYLNPAWGETLGYATEEMIGRPFMDFKSGPSTHQKFEVHKEILAGRILTNHESTFISKSGEERRLNFNATPLYDSGGEIIGAQGTAQDVTERRQAKEERRANQRLLETVFNTIPHSLFVRDANSMFLMANRNLANRYGMEPEDFKGLHITQIPFATEAQRQQFLENDRDVLRTGRPIVNDEIPVLQTDGQTRIFTNSLQPLRGEDGGVIGLVGVAEDITERKQAEAELRDSRDQLRLITDNLPVLITYVDSDLRFRFINKTAEHWYVQSPEDILGKFVGEVHAASSFDKFRSRFESALTGEMITFEDTIGYPDGIERDVDITYVPDIQGDGKVRGFFGLVVDITERKRAEAALKDNENRLQNFIDSSPGNLSYVDREYRYRQANARYLAYVGKSEAALIGHSIAEVMGEETFELFRPWIEEALEGREQHFEISRPVENQGMRDYEVRYIPSFDPRGQVLGFHSSVHDITERKQAEAELRLHSEVIKNMVGGVMMFRAEDETIAYTSPKFDEMFGYEPGELLDRKVLVLNAPGEKTPEQTAISIISSVQQHGWWRGEICNIKKDGTLFWTMAYVSEFSHSRLGRVVLGVNHDITEQKKIEAQLRESQKMEAVGQLAGGIAHEFNNMLQIIISGVHFAGENLHDPRSAKKDLDTILKSAERSAELTKQLLAFSRKTTLAPANLDLNDLTKNLIKMVSPIIGEEISLDFKPGNGLPAVKADPGLLEQALINLCVNARDAMHDGGRITLETRNHHADRAFCDSHNLKHPGDYVVISVSDNGGGIAPEIREHMFEPFFTTKEVGQGTGLGLSMVHGIIQQHDGVIEVLSEPGLGSTFNIYLPIGDSPETKKFVPAAGNYSGGSETILVAEDEKEVLNMLLQALENKGYSVLAAKDGEEAMSAFKKNRDRIDLVILDMVMPKMRGREVYEQIRGSGSEVPVLFSTGYSLDSSDAEHVAERGYRTIQKPYAPTVLYGVVRDMLDRR